MEETNTTMAVNAVHLVTNSRWKHFLYSCSNSIETSAREAKGFGAVPMFSINLVATFTSSFLTSNMGISNFYDSIIIRTINILMMNCVFVNNPGACGNNRLVTGMRGLRVSCAERLRGCPHPRFESPRKAGARPSVERQTAGQKCPTSRRGRGRPRLSCATFSSERRHFRTPPSPTDYRVGNAPVFQPEANRGVSGCISSVSRAARFA